VMLTATFWQAPGRTVKVDGKISAVAGAGMRGTGPTEGKIEFWWKHFRQCC